MRVFFDKSLVGSSKSFVWDDGSIHIDDVLADWHFSASDKRHMSIRAASEAAGCNVVVTPRKPCAAFWKKHDQHPAWHRILSRHEMTSHLQTQVGKVIEFLQDEGNAYYTNQFQVQQHLLDMLQPCKALRDVEEHGIKLDRQGYCSVPVYDNISSATGRMSVTDGPRILTMPREQRRAFTSRWGADGALLEIDYNALELRVLAWVQDLQIDLEDAYMWISKRIAKNDAPRHVIKEATIAAMYGMSRKNFALRYQDMPDAVELYESVRDVLGITPLDKQLSTGPLKNASGRRLTDTTARISHYIQSTAVDVACDGFASLADTIPEIVPCFIIHDAFVVDVHKDHMDLVTKRCNAGLHVGMINRSLPVRCRRFGSE
jgi:hypothetical protein